MSCDILCVGHASYDVSLFVTKFPVENSKTETGRMLEAGGGPAANAAYLLARWGASSGFAGLMGDDYYGRRIASEFESVGVDISLAETRPGIHHQFLSSWSTSGMAVEPLLTGKPQALFFDWTWKPCAGIPRASCFLTGMKRKRHWRPRRHFPKPFRFWTRVRTVRARHSWPAKWNIWRPQERFALQATGMTDLTDESQRRACVEQLRQRYRNKIIITLGESGLIADAGGGYVHLPAFPALAVDTTAAGDIFHGALAYGLARGMEFEETLRLASMAASLSVRVPGGRGSIPSLAEVKAAL